MLNKSSRRYRANNAGSFGALAAYVILTEAMVTLFPEQKTIVVSSTNEKVFQGIDTMIENEGLDFQIEPVELDMDTIVDEDTSDPLALRYAIDLLSGAVSAKVAELETEKALNAELEAKHKSAKGLQDHYFEKYAQYKEQLKAVASLLTESSKEITSNTKDQLRGLAWYLEAID